MDRTSILHDRYVAQFNESIRDSDTISPLRALIDPRFSSLISRAANNREQISQQQVSPTNWAYSPSVATINSNAWTPIATPDEKSINKEKKNWLSSTWKARLQGLLVGLVITAISTGIILGVLLTRSSANSTASTIAPTTASACSELQWNPIGVTVAGNGTLGNDSNQLSDPWSIYIDSNKAIYVADTNNHRIQKWLPNAVSGITVVGVTGVPGSNGSLLNLPRAVYGDSQQNLYIADNNGIRKWSLGASVGTQIPASNIFGSIYSIYVDKNGNLYASTSFSCVVRMWTPTATASTIVAGGSSCGYSSSQLYTVYGFTVDSLTNTIYAANLYLQTIVKWPLGATVGTIVAGSNLTYGGADFLLNYPRDVKCDQYGNLYVADSSNNRVLLFCQNPSSTSGRIIAGYQFTYPVNIGLDSDLNLYVLTQNNYRVQKYSRIV